MSTSVRVKGLRDRMTFKYFLHFFSRLRSASRFSMFWVTFTALFFLLPELLPRVKKICKTVVVKRERLKKTVKWDKMWNCMITALYTTVSLVLKTIVMADKQTRNHVTMHKLNCTPLDVQFWHSIKPLCRVMLLKQFSLNFTVIPDNLSPALR